jgi:hypothetical protein
MQHCKCYTKDALYFYIYSMKCVWTTNCISIFYEMCVNDAFYFYILWNVCERRNVFLYSMKCVWTTHCISIFYEMCVNDAMYFYILWNVCERRIVFLYSMKYVWTTHCISIFYEMCVDVLVNSIHPCDCDQFNERDGEQRYRSRVIIKQLQPIDTGLRAKRQTNNIRHQAHNSWNW